MPNIYIRLCLIFKELISFWISSYNHCVPITFASNLYRFICLHPVQITWLSDNYLMTHSFDLNVMLYFKSVTFSTKLNLVWKSSTWKTSLMHDVCLFGNWNVIDPFPITLQWVLFSRYTFSGSILLVYWTTQFPFGSFSSLELNWQSRNNEKIWWFFTHYIQLVATWFFSCLGSVQSFTIRPCWLH